MSTRSNTLLGLAPYNTCPYGCNSIVHAFRDKSEENADKAKRAIDFIDFQQTEYKKDLEQQHAQHILRLEGQHEQLMRDNDLLRVELNERNTDITTMKLIIESLKSELKRAKTIVIE